MQRDKAALYGRGWMQRGLIVGSSFLNKMVLKSSLKGFFDTVLEKSAFLCRTVYV